MQTWTCTSFDGYNPVGVGAVVSAETVGMAIKILGKRLTELGLKHSLVPEDMVPLPTTHRHLRILCDGDY